LVFEKRKGSQTKEKILPVFYVKKGCALVFARIPSLILRSKTKEGIRAKTNAQPFFA